MDISDLSQVFFRYAITKASNHGQTLAYFDKPSECINEGIYKKRQHFYSMAKGYN